jgi:hypothetical protein
MASPRLNFAARVLNLLVIALLLWVVVWSFVDWLLAQ